mmetsp:Transcript_3740/g.5544  ORF Transcript_3740/g.5544 Transcript_3740/m.5544 type:complete len:241 (+) Transcript_3740:82-804(+)
MNHHHYHHFHFPFLFLLIGFLSLVVVASSSSSSFKESNAHGFGLEIAMDGDTIAVISFGSVHIYKKDGTSWRKIKRFDGLGQSPVSMEKNKVYVGDESNKKVVVFTMVVDDNNNENNNNWIQEDILSDATMFGLNLAVSEQTLIVAAVGSDGYGSAFSYNDNSNNNKNEKKKDVAKMLELDIAPRNDYNAARSMGFHGKNLVFGGNNNLYLFVQSNDGSWRQSDRIELTRALVTMSRSIV